MIRFSQKFPINKAFFKCGYDDIVGVFSSGTKHVVLKKAMSWKWKCEVLAAFEVWLDFVFSLGSGFWFVPSNKKLSTFDRLLRTISNLLQSKTKLVWDYPISMNKVSIITLWPTASHLKMTHCHCQTSVLILVWTLYLTCSYWKRNV